MRLVHALLVTPLGPGGGIFLQHFAGEDAVSRCVLHVDGDVFAMHGDDDIDVDLQGMRDALFNAETVCHGASKPTAGLAEDERDGGDEEEECPG